MMGEHLSTPTPFYHPETEDILLTRLSTYTHHAQPTPRFFLRKIKYIINENLLANHVFNKIFLCLIINYIIIGWFSLIFFEIELLHLMVYFNRLSARSLVRSSNQSFVRSIHIRDD